jgi:large subunit ribosomal protein LP0
VAAGFGYTHPLITPIELVLYWKNSLSVCNRRICTCLIRDCVLKPAVIFCIRFLTFPPRLTRVLLKLSAPVELVHKGERIGSSEAALLAKLGIRPLTYGLVVNIYDNGSVFTPEVLDLTEDDLLDKFFAGFSTVAAVSLAIGYPTLAAAPHSINSYKNLLAIAVETDYSFPLAEKTKEYLKDPSKFAVAAHSVATESASSAPTAAKEEKPVEKEESDDDMGLFD